jgi:hypothetical protein
MNEQNQRDAQRAPVDPIFPKFRGEEADPRERLLGLIAYGLYQEALREWVDGFRQREKRFPSAEELKGYEGSWTASRLDGLKNAAVQILASYADVIATQVELQTLREARRRGFFSDVARWLFSAVLFMGLSAGLVILLSHFGVNIINIVQEFIRARV